MSTDNDRTIFVNKTEVATLIREEKEKVSLAITCLSLKPTYPASIVMNPHPTGYTANFKKFNGRKRNPVEHVSRFIDAMGPFSHNSKLVP